jgi:anthranilate phosphoribosyltransferase
MREKATRIAAPEGVIDTCGTGGDMSGTFNISTTTALVVAACGVPVAKHGNRSVSSKSGSADVLEALGVKIDLEPAKVEACLAETGFGFLFAPLFHPAMKFAIGPRREMGIRTVFNILGPITNPAGAKHQVLGVFSSRLTDTLCQVLGNLGATDVMVVHGEDGLDEITITDGTKVSRLVDGAVENSILSPEDYGIKRAELSAIAGSGKDENARITLEIFEGVLGPRRDVVLMNAAAALAVAGKAPAMSDGFAIAAEALDSGAARAKLRQVVDVSNRL